MKKVLIVDDAAFMRLSLKNILEKNGYIVVGEAGNGIDGIDQYKSLQPDLVTMDITMPIKDGIAALKEIREFDAQAKIVMISAMGQESMVREAVINGARTFIVKPFKEDFVIETLAKIASI